MATITATAPSRSSRIEETGVAHIPEAERDSRPANLAAVFFGGNLAFSVIVFGWLPVTFGLGWWATVGSSALGLALGTLITAPLALLGPRTGTNNTVSSGRALRGDRATGRMRTHAGVRTRLRRDRRVDRAATPSSPPPTACSAPPTATARWRSATR